MMVAHWHASHVLPFSMASMEQAFLSASLDSPAAVAAVWVAMTLRCSFLTSMVGISFLVFNVQFSGERNGRKCQVDSDQ
jgi:hypothetical protein